MKDTDDNIQGEDFRPRGFVQRIFRASSHPGYALIVYAFVLGSAAHLWLADAWDPDWFVANVIYLVGLVLLLVTRAAPGWFCCMVGVLIPLLFFRDQLSQSMYLLTLASGGVVFTLWDARNGVEDSKSSQIFGFILLVRAATLGMYALATLHKINREFLDAQYSCAMYGIDELLGYYRLPPDLLPAFVEPAIPFFAVGLEGSIALAYLLRRRHVAWILAIVFHIPLTVTMAPAFALVMMAGHVSFVTATDRQILLAQLRRRFVGLLPGASVLTGASLAAHGAWPEYSMIPKEWFLWFLLLWLLVSFRPLNRARREDRLKVSRGATAVVAAFMAVFVLNGITPYLGVQYQHAAAMLSNLRIDRGCWNSYVFPESMRITDDYVRVEEVYFGEPGRSEEYEQIVLTQLWSPPQIRQMYRNWCRDEIRPFYMRGTFRGREWVIEDLCATGWEQDWPFEDDGFFGVEIFGDFLRYQKNLERECPQSCIH